MFGEALRTPEIGADGTIPNGFVLRVVRAIHDALLSEEAGVSPTYANDRDERCYRVVPALSFGS